MSSIFTVGILNHLQISYPFGMLIDMRLYTTAPETDWFTSNNCRST